MKNTSGFAAGTLVHTDKGLVPIEQIKVGDLVLTKPESSQGDQVYKPVVKIVVAEGQDVYQMDYVTKEMISGARRTKTTVKEELISCLVVNDIELFWEVSRANDWIPACQLMTGDEFLLPDGNIAVAFGGDDNGMAAQSIIRTQTEGLGWVRNTSEDGYLIDLRNNQIKRETDINKAVINESVEWWRDDLDSKIKRTVFNIEVADTHTYYVGELGVWVHDTNCK